MELIASFCHAFRVIIDLGKVANVTPDLTNVNFMLDLLLYKEDIIVVVFKTQCHHSVRVCNSTQGGMISFDSSMFSSPDHCLTGRKRLGSGHRTET